MDTARGERENLAMLAGASRRQIERVLGSAYGSGLLSEETYVERLDQLLRGGLLDRRRLIGDLYLRGTRRSASPSPAQWLRRAAVRIRGHARGREQQPLLLALDWSGAQHELLIGRHDSCDFVLSDETVSRRHARLVFRDGWILQDLDSTNGTRLNGIRVGRSALRPGDELAMGDQRLQID